MTWISIYFDDENVSGMKVWKYYILSNTCFPVTLGKEKHTSSLPTPPAILFSTTDNHSWYVTTYVAMIPHCQWSLYPAFTAANDGEDVATVYTYCTYLTLQWRVGDYTGQVEQILPPRSDNKCPIWYGSNLVKSSPASYMSQRGTGTFQREDLRSHVTYKF